MEQMPDCGRVPSRFLPPRSRLRSNHVRVNHARGFCIVCMRGGRDSRGNPSVIWHLCYGDKTKKLIDRVITRTWYTCFCLKYRGSTDTCLSFKLRLSTSIDRRARRKDRLRERERLDEESYRRNDKEDQLFYEFLAYQCSVEIFE